MGDVITTLNAVDHDLSNNGLVVYSMQQLAPTGQNTFTLNEFTGDLVLAQSLDLQTSYQIRVTATVSTSINARNQLAQALILICQMNACIN